MDKIILGLVGEMAAGKTTITNYLKNKHGAISFRFSDMLRDILDRVHLDHTRANMQELSTFLRGQFGEDLMSKALVKDIKNAVATIIVTEGIRRPSDTVGLKDLPGFHLVAVVTDEKTRYERISKRKENIDDETKTWEEFQKEGRQESEEKIKDIVGQAMHTIDNNGSRENLYKQLDGLITNICA